MLSTPTRPTATGPSSGAPASTSKKNLQHLVGRALVPFFLPGEDVKENTTHSIPTTNDDFTQGVSSVPVRTFVDGYFVDSGTLTDSQPAPSTEKRQKKASSQSIQTPVKHKSKSNNNNTMPTPIPTPAPAPTSKSTSTSTRYAAPAFCNSPSPMKVPLPKFITQPTSTSLPVLHEQHTSTSTSSLSEQERTTSDVMSLLRPKSLNNVQTEEPEHHYTLHKKSPSVPVTPLPSTSTSTSTSSTDAGEALIQLLRAGTYAHPTAPITSTTSATTITTDTTSTIPSSTTPRLLLLRQDSTGTLGVHSIPVSTVEPDYSNKQYRLPTTTSTSTSYPFFPSTSKPVPSDHSDASAAHLSQTLKSLLSIR